MMDWPFKLLSSEERKERILRRNRVFNVFRCWILKKCDSCGQKFVIADVEQILTSFFALHPPVFEERQILLRAFCCARVRKNWIYLFLWKCHLGIFNAQNDTSPQETFPALLMEESSIVIEGCTIHNYIKTLSKWQTEAYAKLLYVCTRLYISEVVKLVLPRQSDRFCTWLKW
jgi:hypothetical protein